MRAIATAVLIGLTLRAPLTAQTVTTLLHSGSSGAKKDLVIIGDGFTAAQQGQFNTFVRDYVMNGVFAHDLYREDENAFNIYRVNANSVDAGVTQVDSTGAITTARNTAFDYHYSGIWARCWMEAGPNTWTRINSALNTLVPGWDYVFIVLNEPGWGGCGGGNALAVTMSGGGAGWSTGAHEMGHMVGGLCDEYRTDTTTYTGPEPGCANMTIGTTLGTMKWRDFVNPASPFPIGFGAGCSGLDPVQDASDFEGGAARFQKKIWRQACNARMTSNSPEFGPVSYNRMKEVLDPFHDYTYDDAYVGDFDGDGHDDLLLHNANALAIYRGVGSELVPFWFFTGKWGIWDDIMPGDKFYVGDFDGDGKDDVFVFNATDWAVPYLALCRSTGTSLECVRMYTLTLPGWGDMRLHDEFHVADFDGDGKDDLYLFNGQDWSIAYLEMLRSNGTALSYVRRYDDVLPGWDRMLVHDQFYVADFDADKKQDLYVFNGRDWSMGYLQLSRSTGTSLSYVHRYDRTLPGWGDMRPNDEFFAADFDADGRKDIYVFNGRDWAIEYLEMLRSTGSGLGYVRRFDATIPGWDGMAPNDHFFVADVNGDSRQDLYVYNSADWVTEYLGTLRSTGTSLTGGWQADWIGSWNLGPPDRFLVANFNGGTAWQDLFVRNANWFGLLQSYWASVGLTAIYPKWIHNHNYHRLGWW